MSRTRVGSLDSDLENMRHWGWFSQQSWSHLRACWRLAFDVVSSGYNFAGLKSGQGEGAS
jgi:hypothetical protein